MISGEWDPFLCPRRQGGGRRCNSRIICFFFFRLSLLGQYYLFRFFLQRMWETGKENSFTSTYKTANSSSAIFSGLVEIFFPLLHRQSMRCQSASSNNVLPDFVSSWWKPFPLERLRSILPTGELCPTPQCRLYQWNCFLSDFRSRLNLWFHEDLLFLGHCE